MLLETKVNDWKQLQGKGIKIVVLDSGVDPHHPRMQDYSFTEGVSIIADDADYRVAEDFIDRIGHGTAVTSIIKRLVPEAEIYVVRIFQDWLEVKTESLVCALEHVLKEVDCQILHLSLGITHGGEVSQIRELCQQLTDRGTILVSAFDNEGAISYPAAFPNVIGVDTAPNCKGDYDYEFVDSQVVNIRAKGSYQRLPWVQQPYIFLGGASFAAPYVTAYVAKLIEAGVTEQGPILAALRQEASKVYEDTQPASSKPLFKIERAVMFPFNKEMHSIARYQDLLTFELQGVYDTKYSGQIGLPVSKILRGTVENDHIVQNFDNLDWEGDFDAVVLGHVDLISETMGTDLLAQVIELCIEHRKNIYCLDGLESHEELVQRATEAGIQIFYPAVGTQDIPKYRFGKLRKVGKPILGVFGTSSRQGKFTLQLQLRRRLLRDGYSVGQLGTEPTALLYGFNHVYPMGYGSTVKVGGYQAVQVLNDMMGRIEDADPDLIIVGSQSGTVPYDIGHLSQYSFPALDFLMGTTPDSYVLCVNLMDDTKYIQRAVQVLENLGIGKVIGLVIFPLQKKVHPWAGVKMDAPERVEIAERKASLHQETGIPTFVLNSDDDMEALYHHIIDFYC